MKDLYNGEQSDTETVKKLTAHSELEEGLVMQRVYGLVDDELVHRIDEKAGEEAVNLSIALDEKGHEIAHLKDELAVKDGEQDRLKLQLDKVTSEATQLWEEYKGFRNEITKLKKDLDEARSESKQLKDELIKRQSEAERGRTEAEISRIKLENSTLKLKDDEVSLLRAHIHQISEKAAQVPTSKPGRGQEKRMVAVLEVRL